MSATPSPFKYHGMHSKQPWFVLNAKTQFSISVSEHPLISHFYSFQSDPTADAFLAIPDGCVDILFDCDELNPSITVHGTRLTACTTTLPKGHRYVGVRFSPGVLPDFLDISADALIDHDFNLLDLCPEIEQVFESVINENTFSNQVDKLNKYFLRKMTSARSSDLTLSVIDKICQSDGNIRIKELESVTGYTIRTLQRSFKNDVGMTPKAFSRIIRCQSAVYKIHHHTLGFSDLAYDLGFSDQPHFLREFKQLISTTPMEYRNYIHHERYVDKLRYY